MKTGAVLGALLLLPSVALAAPRTFEDLAGLAVQVLNAGVGVAIVLGLVIYFWGIASSMTRLKDGDSERLRTYMLWGILALFVMVSVWGILGLVRNTLFGGGVGGSDFGGGGGPLCATAEDCGIFE